MTDTNLETITKGLQRRLHPGGRAKPYGVPPDLLLPLVPPVACLSGFRFSMQASHFHYCQPRNNEGPWTHVELGALSHPRAALMPYAENAGYPLDTVYPHVPLEFVAQLVLDEGGFA